MWWHLADSLSFHFPHLDHHFRCKFPRGSIWINYDRMSSTGRRKGKRFQSQHFHCRGFLDSVLDKILLRSEPTSKSTSPHQHIRCKWRLFPRREHYCHQILQSCGYNSSVQQDNLQTITHMNTWDVKKIFIYHQSSQTPFAPNPGFSCLLFSYTCNPQEDTCCHPQRSLQAYISYLFPEMLDC